MQNWKPSAKVVMIAALMFVVPQKTAFPQVPAAKAVIAILGEAEDQGYKGMLAVAVGIRNRGTLKGVYGLRAERPNTPGMIPAKYWKMAEKAWAESERNRIHNADHWENIKQFGKPFWVKGMKKICTIGDHVFYTVKANVRKEAL